MEQLEEQLKRLALRGPSVRLDERMEELFSLPAAERPSNIHRPRTISFRWALACAGLIGLVGYLTGAYTSPSWLHRPLHQGPLATAATAQPAVKVTIQYNQPGKNPFDTTRAADDGLRSAQLTKISHSKESQS